MKQYNYIPYFSFISCPFTIRKILATIAKKKLHPLVKQTDWPTNL